MENKILKFRTRSGLNFAMDEKLYHAVSENDDKLTMTECHIMAGDYFPQIMRFIGTLVLIFNGKIDFISILVVNVVVTIISTLIWFIIPLYKLPGVSSAITLLGQIVFRFFIHIITLIILSLAVCNDWKVIVFSLLSGGIAMILDSFVFGYRFSIKRNNDIANHVLK